MHQFKVYWPRPTGFKGRDELLTTLHAAIQQQVGGQRTAVLCGEDGLGKTQIAVEYAYRYRDTYPGGVYWINARRDWTAELATLARQFGLKPIRTAVSVVEQNRWLTVALQRFLADAHKLPTLLIFDNVLNPHHILDREVGPGLHVADMAAYLLVTSRITDAPQLPAVFQKFAVEPLPLDDARAIILDVRPHSDPDLLCQEVGCFPLTLGLIRKTLTTFPETSVEDFLAALDPAEDPVDTILNWHVAHLTSPEAYELWALAATFRRETIIPLARLQLMTGFSAAVFAEAVDMLNQVGLIDLLANDNLELHSRIRRYIRDYLPDYRAPLPAAVDRMLAAYYTPQVLYEQALGRGVDAVLNDFIELYLATLEDGTPPYELTQFQRLLEWEADHEPAQLIQQLRERAHHQQIYAVRDACDHWLASRPHFATPSPWYYPRNPSALRTFIGHEDRITDVIPLDAQHVLTTSQDGLLRLWDIYAGQTVRLFRGHQGTVSCVTRLNADCVVSGSSDKTLRVWDLHTGQTLRVLEGHLWPITALVRIDDQHVLSGSADDTLRLWNVATGEMLHLFEGHTEPVTAVICWDDSHVLSAAHDNTIRLWDLATGQAVRVYNSYPATVTGLAKVDDRHFVTAAADHTLRLWDVETGQILQTYEGHTASVIDVMVLDRQLAVSAANDHTLRVWDLATGATLRVLKGHSRAITALAQTDERYVVSVSADLTLRLWDVMTPHPETQTVRGHTDWVMAVAGLDTTCALSASADRTICVWDLHTAQIIDTLRGHDDSVNALAIVDGEVVASASSDTTIRLWNLRTGTTQVLHGHRDEVTSLAHLDSTHLLSGSSDRTLRLWNLRSASTERVLEGHEDRVTAVAAVGPGLVLSGSSDFTVRLWDTHTGSVLHTLVGHTGTVRSLAVIGDTHALSAANDRTIRLWELATGQALAVLEGHLDWVTAVLVLGDSYCLSASFDRTLRLWNLQTSEVVIRLALDDPLLSLADLGAGRVLVGDLAGRIRVIHLTLP